MGDPVQEKPICVANYEDCQSIIKAFHCMSNENQNEFMKLHNCFEDCSNSKSNLDAKIVGIYKTNAFDKGVGIKSSRFKAHVIKLCSNIAKCYDLGHKPCGHF